MNNHHFVSGAASFSLDTETDPWTITVMDNNGYVLMRIPPERLMEIVMTMKPGYLQSSIIDMDV
jgi:uncharacterized FlaG/YvyC family protein